MCNTNRRAKVHKKQQLMTPSFRFPLRAGGTDGLGSPREAGGTLRRGAIVNSDCAVGIIYQGDKGGEDNMARFEKGVIGCACFSDFGGAIGIKTAP